MGAVYLAEDTVLHRKVALKIPVFGNESDENAVKRFMREARAAATIQHPHVCAVHDVGQLEGRHYLTMTYVEGMPLSEWMHRQDQVAVEQSLQIVQKVALGLHAAHQAGVIHRDLKPSNILMDVEDEPFIIDFGMARRFDKQETVLTATGIIAGTPAYMSPEQIMGNVEQIGPAVDIYALGVILYELLAGRLPFGGNVATMLGNVVSEAPAPLRTHAAHLPEALEPICAKALAKQPHDRYPHAAAFAATIAEYLEGGATNDPPVLQAENSVDEVPASDRSPRGFLASLWKAAFSRKSTSRDSS